MDTRKARRVRHRTWSAMRFCLVASLTGIALAGCSPRLPTVEGQVTLDGQSLENARIVFESPDKATAVAKTDADGHYTLMTGAQPGAAAGSYSVAISAYKTANGGAESPVPVLRTPKKYNTGQTSGLTADVQPGQNRDVDFHLQTVAK